jgi:hypothetical protein
MSFSISPAELEAPPSSPPCPASIITVVYLGTVTSDKVKIVSVPPRKRGVPKAIIKIKVINAESRKNIISLI